MSIAHELSSDVAAAVLAREKDEPLQDTSELAEVVMEVHATLRELSAEARRKNRRAWKQAKTSSRSNTTSAD
jgi:16S rRNA C1402 N4-methylase RsmH